MRLIIDRCSYIMYRQYLLREQIFLFYFKLLYIPGYKIVLIWGESKKHISPYRIDMN